jgi:hypothetical protein
MLCLGRRKALKGGWNPSESLVLSHKNPMKWHKHPPSIHNEVERSPLYQSPPFPLGVQILQRLLLTSSKYATIPAAQLRIWEGSRDEVLSRNVLY